MNGNKILEKNSLLTQVSKLLFNAWTQKLSSAWNRSSSLRSLQIMTENKIPETIQLRVYMYICFCLSVCLSVCPPSLPHQCRQTREPLPEFFVTIAKTPTITFNPSTASSSPASSSSYSFVRLLNATLQFRASTSP
jgi:hypothetical protein